MALDALAALRDKPTDPSRFRRLAYRVSLVLAIEATRELSVISVRVETLLEVTDGRAIRSDVIVVPVLRAGLGMVEAVLELLPCARVGHVGIQRGEQTAVASRYCSKLPRDLSQSVALIVQLLGSKVMPSRLLSVYRRRALDHQNSVWATRMTASTHGPG